MAPVSGGESETGPWDLAAVPGSLLARRLSTEAVASIFGEFPTRQTKNEINRPVARNHCSRGSLMTQRGAACGTVHSAR